MSVLYWYMRYGSLACDDDDSLEDAIGRAWADQENGTAVAVGIEDAGTFYDSDYIEAEIVKLTRQHDEERKTRPVRHTPWLVEVSPPAELVARGSASAVVITWGAYETREAAERMAAVMPVPSDRVKVWNVETKEVA